ncbi:MAG: hypothetical protein KGZ97_00015 [Bacteroidetes bacterium]|nr:hypothetical protein [Bacteroidota bacterium]
MVIFANVLNTSTYNDDLNLKEILNNRLLEISERGISSNVIFARRETPNASRINVMYQTDSKNINAEIRIFKENTQLHQANVKGKLSEIDTFITDIIDEVMRSVR